MYLRSIEDGEEGLKYLVAHAISNGNIVYWSGWHKGSKSDIKMFKEELMGLMDEDECIEADAGCSGKFCIKNPNTAKTRRAKQQRHCASKTGDNLLQNEKVQMFERYLDPQLRIT